jgi:hypothetical protein
MDLAAWGLDKLDWKFFAGILNIIIIDIILAGDNAVVIAMAVRSLPRQQRKWGIIMGSGAAVLLRVVLTYFVAQLLEIKFIKLAGGVLIAWIAVKLFVEGAPEQEDREVKTLWQAMWLIVVADITMSGRGLPWQSVSPVIRSGPVHPLGGLHQQPAVPAHGSLPHHHLYRRRGAGTGGRGDDLHRSFRGGVAGAAQMVVLHHGGGVGGGGDPGGQIVAPLGVP